MKKYAYLTLCLVLTAAMLVGCGCTNRKMETTPSPTVLPTNEEVWDNTQPTTRATTEATTPSATNRIPGETDATIDRGNGPLEDMIPGTTSGSTESTDGTGAAEGRSRSIMPNVR